MDNQSDSQPRDSRLEQFTTTASNIISIEHGLTSLALSKIRHLAKEQHLSDSQVIECLHKISSGSSTLGRVGRYEQMFLDRIANDLSIAKGAVLSPKTVRNAIRLATDEYQISISRAQQLLDHAAKLRGVEQISATDARNLIRVLIAQKLGSPNGQRGDFEDELVAHAANFGVSADEVSALLDTEIETRNQLKSRRDGRLVAVAASILIALCVTVTGCWLWLNTPTSRQFNQINNEPIADSNTVATKDMGAGTIAEATDGSQNRVNKPTTNLPLRAPQASKFESGDFVSLTNTASILEFERWQKRFIELADQNFEQSLSDSPPPSLADRRKKQDAIEALQSEQSDERIQTRALDDFIAVAKRIDDITAEEATLIAAFCFQKHDSAIEISIVRTVKQFGRWPRFLLAVSDAFAADDQQSATDDWNQRLAFAITDGKLKNNDNFPASFFAMARLRVQERLIAIKRAQEAEGTNVENDFVHHLHLFISSQMNSRAHQSYFNRLIDTRALDLPPMQRQIELQQILIEALLFAKSDDESLSAGEIHFRKLNSATTLGAQLAQSRQTTLALVSLHMDWLRRGATVAGASSHRASRWLEAPATEKARRLRDRAEEAIISRDDSLIEKAIVDYRSAIACGDRAIIRSCLRGLIEIAPSQTDRSRYQRQLDFVNGGQRGPYSKFAGDAGDERSTQTDLQAIRNRCRQLRRSSRPQERSATPAPTNATEIWAALNCLANRRSPPSVFELDLLLRIEAEAMLAMESTEASLSSLQFPWPIQATLPPVEVTPLVPLPR